MQIQVISGTPVEEAYMTGMVFAGLTETRDGFPVVHAHAYAVAGLLGILEVRAARGEREILVMGCSRDQIQAVLERQSETEEVVDLENLVLHLVRSDPIEQNAG